MLKMQNIGKFFPHEAWEIQEWFNFCFTMPLKVINILYVKGRALSSNLNKC